MHEVAGKCRAPFINLPNRAWLQYIIRSVAVSWKLQDSEGNWPDFHREKLGSMHVDLQLSGLAKLLRAIDSDDHGLKAGIALDSASQIMHIGVRALEAEDYKLSLKCVYEAQQPLEVGRQVCNCPDYRNVDSIPGRRNSQQLSQPAKLHELQHLHDDSSAGAPVLSSSPDEGMTTQGHSAGGSSIPRDLIRSGQMGLRGFRHQRQLQRRPRTQAAAGGGGSKVELE